MEGGLYRIVKWSERLINGKICCNEVNDGIGMVRNCKEGKEADDPKRLLRQIFAALIIPPRCCGHEVERGAFVCHVGMVICKANDELAT